MSVAGTFFAGGSSRAVPARASVTTDRMLTIADESGQVLLTVPFKKVRVSSRLARLLRRLEFPGGGHFETPDNDGVDAMFREAGRWRWTAPVDRLERSLRSVTIAVLIAAASVTLMVLYGFPAFATWLAWKTPRPVLTEMSEQTLGTLDRLTLAQSQLTAAEKSKAQALFARVAAVGAQGKSGYQLVFRNGGRLGPNAFSLPDGTVIMTDQLYKLVKRDDELEGVFGHEITHADKRHALQMVYEASLIPVTIALITGDVSQFSQVATVLPTYLIESSYSRAVEQQADDGSAAMMKRIGADPAALGELLQRMDKEVCGKSGCTPSWLGTHPATAERAARLRDEAKAPVSPQK